MEKFKIAVEITEMDDGGVIVQQLNPEGPIGGYYGRYLGPGQIAKLGITLLNGSPIWVMNEPQPERQAIQYIPKERTALDKLRSRWEAMRSRMAPKVYARHGDICKECGTDENLTIDHIIPLARGGTNKLENLQVLCKSCNSRKGASYVE